MIPLWTFYSITGGLILACLGLGVAIRRLTVRVHRQTVEIERLRRIEDAARDWADVVDLSIAETEDPWAGVERARRSLFVLLNGEDA